VAQSPQQQYQERRGSVNVLILGPYGDCKEDLIQMRKFVIEKEYKNTRIVEELPELEDIPQEPKEEYFLEKSKYYIENWAEILIFYLPLECDCKSVLLELFFMCEHVPIKCIYSTIIRHEEYDLGTLIKGMVRKMRVADYPYREKSQIQDMAFSACFCSLENIFTHTI